MEGGEGGWGQGNEEREWGGVGGSLLHILYNHAKQVYTYIVYYTFL